MNIINESKNKLLKRKEITISIDRTNNPGFEDALNVLADNFKIDKSLIVIKSLKSKFGQHSFLIDALIYDTIQDKEKIEPKKREKKSKIEEVKK